MAKNQRPLEKVTVKLWEGQRERLATYFPKLGYNGAIRSIIDNALRQLDAQAEEKISNAREVSDIDIPLE